MFSLLLITSGGIIAFPSVIISDIKENNSTIFGDHISFTESELDFLGTFCGQRERVKLRVTEQNPLFALYLCIY